MSKVKNTIEATEPTTEQINQMALEAITLLINGTEPTITVVQFIKAMQAMSSEDKQKLPTFKINSDLLVSKAKQGSNKYKVTDNHNTIIEYLTATGKPQTKSEIAKGIGKEEGPVLATCQAMRNGNRAPEHRLSMIVTVADTGKVTHQFYITDLLHTLSLGANQIVTTL